MEQWFAALSIFEKVYWLTAGISSVIFLILLVLTFIGAEVDDLGDVDAEIDGDTGIGFQFLSFKNLMGFFTIFGWSGIACIDAGYSNGLTMIISVVCGLLMMLAMATLFYYLTKLDSDGSLKMKNALNSVGEVYLTIGANRSRIGKVQVNVQGGLRSLEALTDESTDLIQGDIITVTSVTDNGILIVNKHSK
ncbi:hypothetical protein [Patiriisocius marinus]|uniref:NfeD-like C-terminal domain-containing protein n=1 Tax=Patiriisocius marinus TaxID=1397112 RepID=A0A5J4J724_9FLAO|nr:hypothetical protein [Patiriisocius marinus]GER60317.1 hypothetical protein ULMA_24250 [Patiriisocius marinus]